MILIGERTIFFVGLRQFAWCVGLSILGPVYAQGNEVLPTGTEPATRSSELERRVKGDIEEVRLGRIGFVDHDLWMVTPTSIPLLIGNLDDPRPLVGPSRACVNGTCVEFGQVTMSDGIQVPTQKGTVGEAICWLLRHSWAHPLWQRYKFIPTTTCHFADRKLAPEEKSAVDEWRAWCVETFPESKDICLGSRSAFMRDGDKSTMSKPKW